jgi:hypothetical protein
VVDVANDAIGQVKEVRAGDFLVDQSRTQEQPSGDPAYLPFERIHAMTGDRITLDIPASQVEEQASVPVPLNL